MPTAIEVITLFSPDVPATRAFYERVFDCPVVHGDAQSALLAFDNFMINLLAEESAPELMAPAPVAQGGHRMLLTVRVDDVDAQCRRLDTLGVPLLNGPMDRPWGRRTASFVDPSGFAWEFAQVLEGN